MKEVDLFLTAIDTLLNAWGGDTPPEALWAMNDIIAWLNKEYNKHLPSLDEEDYGNETFYEELKTIQKTIREMKNDT